MYGEYTVVSRSRFSRQSSPTEHAVVVRLAEAVFVRGGSTP
jgi:hypothetical protein